MDIFVSALTLLIGRLEKRPACKRFSDDMLVLRLVEDVALAYYSELSTSGTLHYQTATVMML